MSLIDDFIASSETDHGPSVVNLFGDALVPTNGYHGLDAMEPQTGYVSTGFGQVEKPIFSLDYVQFQLPATLVDMAVSNNILVIALDTFRILRIDLDNPLEIARKPGDGAIERLFFDPTGRHLLITTEHGENYYLYEKWRRTKHLSKLKGIVITSVAWNKQATLADPSTKEILLGTKKGLIYETMLEPTDEFFRREQRYLEQVYSIHESTMPITGLHFEQFPVHTRKYFVLATTPTRIYQFVGFIANGGGSGGSRSPVIGYASPSTNANDNDDQQRNTPTSTDRAIFEGLFSKYDVNPGFQELPGELPHSQVHFFSKFHELQQQGVAQVFAWLTGPGIYRGDLVFGSQNVGDSVIDNVQLLPYPTMAADDDAQQIDTDYPLAVTLTEFHYILLYKDRVRAICQLNDQIVYEEMIPMSHGEHVLGLTVDDIKKTFWVYTSQSMYELVINNEERDVWQLYLEKSQYNMALQYCKDAAQKDKVYTAQAKDYFEQKRYQMSAQFFAESTVPFEHVALQFIEQDEMDALRVYLSHKLDHLQKKDRTQKTMLATWLVELYLSKLDALDNCEDADTPVSNDMTITSPTTPHSGQYPSYADQRSDVNDEFCAFLDSYHAHLHAPTTYHLMSNHGRSSTMLYFAALINDHERIIHHWMTEKQWKTALEVLSKQNNNELFYRFSPVLMENEPYETNQAIRYLSFVVTKLGSTDAAIHNFLLTLYATQPTDDESALLAYLKNEGRDMHYNLDYALRLCNQHGRTQSCVHIYGQMGLYEEAVHLALQNHDVELACINADKPEDDDDLRKKLWLTIAEQVVQDSKDIKSTMRFLSESQLLHIDDILPFFSDFKVINDFKQDICTALENYNHEIEELKTEMEDATKNADNIRFDIRDLKSR
ncbi:Pep3/Vps18/deep orange family-domain-containing protein [Gongronella butleri]|nr:Pep3/Vps18/deep orange family-domain-containing protein [Gongronella butleri]